MHSRKSLISHWVYMRKNWPEGAVLWAVSPLLTLGRNIQRSLSIFVREIALISYCTNASQLEKKSLERICVCNFLCFLSWINSSMCFHGDIIVFLVFLCPFLLKAVEFKALTQNVNCFWVRTGRSEHDFLIILSMYLTLFILMTDTGFQALMLASTHCPV